VEVYDMHIQKDIPTHTTVSSNDLIYEVPEKFCFKMTEVTIKNVTQEPVNVSFKDGDKNLFEIYVIAGQSITTSCIMRHFYDSVIVGGAEGLIVSASGYLC
jgi:hypothetical protein